MSRHYIGFGRRDKTQTKTQERNALKRKERTTMGKFIRTLMLVMLATVALSTGQAQAAGSDGTSGRGAIVH